MNINPAAAASVAGTARAAARGGEADSQATESTRQQSKVDSPAGKSGESAVEAGDQTEDRDADGRQLYDTFEQSEGQTESEEQPTSEEPKQSANQEGVGGELDFEA